MNLLTLPSNVSKKIKRRVYFKNNRGKKQI